MFALIAGPRLVTQLRCNRVTVTRLKTCLQNTCNNKSILWPKTNQILIKRDISFAKLRNIWRIILLRDRGVKQNFRSDRVDRKHNVLVYKAEYNRVTTLGGIVFPLLVIVLCVAAKTFPKLMGMTDPHGEDPHEHKSFLGRHIYELIILVSVMHISLCKRYVLRIYYNKARNEFTLSTWRWYLPFTTRSIACKPGDAKWADWSQNEFVSTFIGNCKVNNHRLYIVDSEFIYPAYHNLLFGLDDLLAIKDLSTDSVDMQNLMAERLYQTKKKNLSASDD